MTEHRKPAPGELAAAVERADLPAVESLLARGADVTETISASHVPLLMHAVGGPDRTIAEKLVKAGAPLDARDDNGFTALLQAVVTGNMSMVAFLVAAGANLDEVNPRSGYTALMWAVQMNRRDMISCLLDAGAGLEATSTAGKTVYDLAEKKPEIAALLDGLPEKRAKAKAAAEEAARHQVSVAQQKALRKSTPKFKL